MLKCQTSGAAGLEAREAGARNTVTQSGDEKHLGARSEDAGAGELKIGMGIVEGV